MEVVFVSLVFCTPFFAAPVVILFGFQSRAKDFPPEIVVDNGKVSGLCLRALCCAIAMMLLTAASPAIAHLDTADIQEISYTRMKDHEGKHAKQDDSSNTDRNRIVHVLPNAALR